MGAEQSKSKCLYLPAQSGKTRKMEELIKEHKLGELFEPVDINIIISANSRLLVEQTKTRMTNDLATESEEGANDACIKGRVFSWTSGTKESNITPVDLAFRLLGEIEMVVICAHAVRLRYLLQTLERLAACPMFTKKINIWIDEADASINLWAKYEHILRMCTINQVTLVSATFDAVMSKYKSLSVLPYLQTHPECYRGLRNAIRHEINFVGSAGEYVKRVIETNVEKLAKPGMRAFIPGSLAKASHDSIADLLHKEHGFVVIIINGERKEILVPEHEAIDLRCYLTVENGQVPTEFNTQLAKLYKENNWARYPLAITGFYCVERGVTFQCGPEEGVHDGFMFDYGIIPPIACAAEAYQTMARLFGNVGHIDGYKPVEVYTNAATFSRVEKQEEIAINIARMVAEQGLENVEKKDLKAAEAPHKRVPVLVKLSEDQFKNITAVTGEKKKSMIIASIMSMVQDDNAIAHEFRNVVSTTQCIQISAPRIETQRSYKIHITDVVAASVGNYVYSMMDVDKDTKKKTCWQIYVDVKEKRLVALWQVFN
jgi:hypothetical protein